MRVSDYWKFRSCESRKNFHFFVTPSPSAHPTFYFVISLLVGCKESFSTRRRGVLSRLMRRRVRRDRNAVPQPRPIVDCCFQLIAVMNWADASGRSAQNHIARQKCKGLARE